MCRRGRPTLLTVSSEPREVRRNRFAFLVFPERSSGIRGAVVLIPRVAHIAGGAHISRIWTLCIRRISLPGYCPAGAFSDSAERIRIGFLGGRRFAEHRSVAVARLEVRHASCGRNTHEEDRKSLDHQ